MIKLLLIIFAIIGFLSLPFSPDPIFTSVCIVVTLVIAFMSGPGD